MTGMNQEPKHNHTGDNAGQLPDVQPDSTGNQVENSPAVKGTADLAGNTRKGLTLSMLGANLRARLRKQGGNATGGKKKKGPLLVVGLAIVFVFLLIRMSKPVKVSSASVENTDDIITLVTEDITIDWQVPAAIATLPRDPMLPIENQQIKTSTPTPPQPPSQVPDESIAALVVRSVVYSEDRPSAMIGSDLVHEGDEINGAVVNRIDKKGVEFSYQGKTIYRQVSSVQNQ